MERIRTSRLTEVIKHKEKSNIVRVRLVRRLDDRQIKKQSNKNRRCV